MTNDGLDPPGEQLELFPVPGLRETVVHRAEIHGYGFMFYWSCACGASGQPTTNGRAVGGRARHFAAVRRRMAARPDRP